ncbi:MAG: DNA helicase RecQ [Clostridiales bacterium]|nr:DNA helicase RecQ [Clostridiales bacterium]
MEKQQVLKQYFGHSTFRYGQEPLIDQILAGRDVMGIMPTGGGKSLCYQVPALMLPGLTLVISPLISLMTDQVAALQYAGVQAACIHSGLSAEQMRAVYRNMASGHYRLVYVAPERLEGPGFQSLLQRLELSLVAVDEAHCISQWGQDFRPSYLKITSFLEQLPRRPVVAAFTATATEEVRADIEKILKLQEPFRMITGFDRPNLYFDVLRPRDKLEEVLRLLSVRRGKSGIIYCATRANVERVCEVLNDNGIPATRYHAGLTEQERQKNQDDFQYDRQTVMVATNAFGMGIDKSNVNFVIHFNMPKSLEAYYQEAGRAGRDGEPADCILLYAPADVMTAKYLIQNGADNEALDEEARTQIRQQDYARLEQMNGYCKTTGCLRGVILGYFGQAHEAQCNACGNCCATMTRQDITTQAQMVLSCVKRIRSTLGYSVGAATVVGILRGSKSKRILELGLNQLSTYGLMKQLSAQTVQAYVDCLLEQGYLRTHPVHGALELLPEASEVLFRGQPVEMPVKVAPVAARVEKQKAARQLPQERDACLQRLKAVRMQIAQQEQVPAYVVFSNATLTDMAEKRPHSLAEFLEVNGVGQVKAARYGAAFLDAIRKWEEEQAC